MKRYAITAFALALLPAIAVQAHAEPQATFSDILEAVPAVTGPGDTPDAVKRASGIVSALGKMLAQLSEKASVAPLALPVQVEGLITQDARFRNIEKESGFGILLIGGSGSITRIRSSVVIADGHLDISYANNSIIIASGGVELSHGSNNIILAGYFVDISHEGNSGAQYATPAEKERVAKLKTAPTRSLVFSGNLMHISHAKSTIVSAPGLLDMSHAKGVLLVNSPSSSISHRGDSTEQYFEALKYPKKEFVMPIGEIDLRWVKGREKGMLYIGNEDGIPLVFHQPIEDCCSPLHEKLGGWQPVIIVDNAHLVLEKEGKYGYVIVKRE